MKCPKCGIAFTKIRNTWHNDHSVSRRRVCLACKHPFNTIEKSIPPKVAISSVAESNRPN